MTMIISLTTRCQVEHRITQISVRNRENKISWQVPHERPHVLPSEASHKHCISSSSDNDSDRRFIR